VNDLLVESPIRVFLLIENRLLREALGRLFRKRSDLQVVGQGESSDSLPQELLDCQCDVLALDFFDPELLATLLPKDNRDASDLRTMLIGMEGDPQQFLDAVRAGVRGYLLKDASASDVVAGIRSIFKGEAICPPRLCASLFQCVAQSSRQVPDQALLPRHDLTLRQLQLVNLVAKGLTNKEIAAQLNLSEFTVRNHIHRIMRQVDVGSRREAVEAVRAQELSASFSD
jgi:DNA-binding NarL/FixJ family response regulator